MNLFSIINRYSEKGKYSISDVNSTAEIIGASLEDYYKVINVIIPTYVRLLNGK